jgi:5'-nucleotidase
MVCSMEHLREALARRDRPFVLCVDLDGVVADYTAAFRRVVATETESSPSNLRDPRSWNFADCGWGIRDSDHFLALHSAAVVDYRIFSTMPEIPGASDMLWALSDADVHIRIVTHRLVKHWNHDVVVADTVSWLQRPRFDGRPRIPFRDLCFIGDKAEVGGDLYLDDAPHNIANLRVAGITAAVFSAPYNKTVEGLRVDSWADVPTLVSALA